MIKKNDIIPLKITSATAEGSGVGKTSDGMAVFVPLTAVGDEIEARILKVKKTCAFGKIENIIKPASSRVAPDCPHFFRCGGCVWRHISYEEECRIKRQKVIDAVERIGGIKAPVMPIIASEKTLRYRNKAQLPVGTAPDGSLQMGFYTFHSHRIIDCEDCLLQPEAFAEEGDSKVVKNATVQVKDTSKSFMMLNEFPTVQELTGALNQIGATTRDMITILQSIKAAGALQAELVTL